MTPERDAPAYTVMSAAEWAYTQGPTGHQWQLNMRLGRFQSDGFRAAGGPPRRRLAETGGSA